MRRRLALVGTCWTLAAGGQAYKLPPLAPRGTSVLAAGRATPCCAQARYMRPQRLPFTGSPSTMSRTAGA